MNFEGYELVSVNVSTEIVENYVKVEKNKNIVGEDENTYAKLLNINFSDGEIRVKVRSRLLDDAPEYARGFIGIAFRIDEKDEAFESFYIRPTNGRSTVQLRRNRSVQYFSYPDFKYFHSRETNPGEYETYADMELDRWIDMRIVVSGEKAELYLDSALQPSLVVNDLKHGKSNGSLGLFVDIGTEGHFKDLEINYDV